MSSLGEVRGSMPRDSNQSFGLALRTHQDAPSSICFQAASRTASPYSLIPARSQLINHRNQVVCCLDGTQRRRHPAWAPPPLHAQALPALRAGRGATSVFHCLLGVSNGSDRSHSLALAAHGPTAPSGAGAAARQGAVARRATCGSLLASACQRGTLFLSSQQVTRLHP